MPVGKIDSNEGDAMKTLVIIQARMGSSRLPGKVLADIAGQPMLAHVVNRVRYAKGIDDVVVATSVESRDDALASLCLERGWSCFRGDHHDVLDRYYQAAAAFGGDVIVRITADCPLIDPEIIEAVAGRVLESNGQIDYCSNVISPRTFPRGLDAEAFTRATLNRCWIEATDGACREHVTPYVYRNPDKFRLAGCFNDTDESGHRWTVDTPEDMQLIRQIFSHFGTYEFRWRDVLTAFRQHPEWLQINAHVQQKAA